MKPDTQRHYQQRILRVLVHIQSHLDDPCSLEELAQVACFSPYHFHRIFSGMVGETVKQHVRRLRLERAAAQLRHTERGVTAIAFDAGYESHEAFTRAFRDLLGESPSSFRHRRRAPAFSPAGNGVRYAPSSLHTFNPNTGAPIMNVRLTHLQPLRVACMRHTGPYEQSWPTWQQLIGWAANQGLEGRRLIGISHDDPQVTPAAKLRHDACTEVPADFTAGDEVFIQEIAGGDYAVLTHRGPYENLPESYTTLYGHWLPQSGREPRSAPSFEIMHNLPTEVAATDLLTEIYLPLAPTGSQTTP